MSKAFSSKKTVMASANEMPCFRRFAELFASSHSKRSSNMELQCSYTVVFASSSDELEVESSPLRRARITAVPEPARASLRSSLLWLEVQR